MNDLLTRWNLRPPDPYGFPYVSGYEALDNLVKQFNQMPVSYDTDPVTGQVIASKNMAKPMGPITPPHPALQGYFRSPHNIGWGADYPNLWGSWVLPPGALTGPKMLDQSAPSTDLQRQFGEQMGISNVGQSVSTLNPLTHWPETSFQAPMGSEGLPVFGTNVDYTKGQWTAPPIPGVQGFGTFDAANRASPGTGRNPPIPTDYEQNLRQKLMWRMM